MLDRRIGKIIFSAVLLMGTSALATSLLAQASPQFTPGNLVVVVEGCGVHGGTCTNIPNGTGTGTGNSSNTGYGDNQATPLTLFQYAPTGTSSVAYVNSLVLPQTASGANIQISGEYGSSSEGTLHLSGNGQYLTLMGYGIDALSFNANPENYGTLLNPKGASNYAALGQTGSLTLNNQTLAAPYPNGYTPVARVVALIDANGNVNTSTPLYNIFDWNNPRSAFTENGSTVYVSGQGSATDSTGGVFYSPVGAVNNTPTAITGLDACASSGCTTLAIAQDTRDVQIYNGALYIAVDSTEGKSDNRSFIGTLGNPPATSLYVPSTSTPYATGPTMLTGFGNTGGTGKVTIATGANTNGNPLNNSTTVVNGSALNLINLSPSSYFFASPSVLYVADTGNPKNNSNGEDDSTSSANIGDGGLQKWVNSSPSGTGTWSLKYTLYQGLNLVNNGGASGTTGLYSLTGYVSGGSVYLFATNATLSDTDLTYLYGITDTLSNTTPPGTSLAFTLLDTAPSDSNFRGLSLAPSIPNGDVEVTSSPSGLAFTASGTGCAPGTSTTPLTLTWTPGSACSLSVVTPQAGPAGVQYTFSQWQDGTTSTTDNMVAPATTATYTATFNTQYQLTTSAGTGGSVSAGGYYTAGTNATITATPASGYYFVNFTGATTSTSNPLSLPITAPASITANFATVASQTITLTKPAPTTASYGSTFTVAATASSGLAVTFTSSGSCSNVGSTYTITSGTGSCAVIASQAGNAQYAAATTVQQTVTASKVGTTTTLSVSGTSVNPTQSVTITTTVASVTTGSPTGSMSFYDNGTLLTTTPVALAADVATYSTLLAAGIAHNITAIYSGDANFAGSTNTSTTVVTVAALDFTFALPASTTLTVMPGQNATSQLSVAPSYGTYPGTVSFSITGLPVGATAAFSPASIPATGGSQTVTLTITAPSSAAMQHPSLPSPMHRETPFALACLLLIGAGSMRRFGRKLRGVSLVALLLLGGAAAAFLSGCGGASQPSANYTLTMTATSGNIQHSATVTLTLQ